MVDEMFIFMKSSNDYIDYSVKIINENNDKLSYLKNETITEH